MLELKYRGLGYNGDSCLYFGVLLFWCWDSNSQVLGMPGRHLPHLWIGSQSYRGGLWQSDRESLGLLTMHLMGGPKVDPLACVLIILLWHGYLCRILDLPYFLGSLPGSFNFIIMQTYACLNDILTHSFSGKVQTQIHFLKKYREPNWKISWIILMRNRYQEASIFLKR